MPDFPKNGTLTAMVQEFKPEVAHMAAPLFPVEQTISDSFEFDVVGGSRTIAPFRNPDGPAGVVAVTPKTRKLVKLAVMREKKALRESLLRWFDGAGQKAPEPAMRAVARELSDLDGIVERTLEYLRWKLLTTGAFTITIDGVSMAYDFGLTNTATAGVTWSTIATSTPIDDILTWKEALRKACGEDPTDIYLSTVAIKYIFQSTKALAMMSEITKDKYRETGTVLRLCDMDVHVQDNGYLDGSAAFKYFLSTNGTAGNMAILKCPGAVGQTVHGPAVDSKAPEGHIGKFAKSWEDEDPAGRWVLETLTGICGLTQPSRVFAATLW